MKPSFAAIELTEREIRRKVRSMKRRLAWSRLRFTARNEWNKLWFGFWRPLVYFWLKVGGGVFAGGIGLVLAGRALNLLK